MFRATHRDTGVEHVVVQLLCEVLAFLPQCLNLCVFGHDDLGILSQVSGALLGIGLLDVFHISLGG